MAAIEVVEAESVDYSRLQRLGGRTGWGWALAGCVLAVLGALLAPLVIQLPVALLGAITHASALDLTKVMSEKSVTPVGLGVLNLSIATWILVAIGLTAGIHRLRPRWLLSVAGRVRWRWLAVCTGLAVVALAAALVVQAFVPSDGEPMSAHAWTSRSTAFALVVLFTTPLQAIGEEFLFRGYLTQAVGGVVPWRWVAVVVPALLFTLAHGTQSVPVFIDRLAFGLLAGLLVIVTGGLEAGIAMHVLNNILAFGLAIAMGDVSKTLAADGGTWWLVPVTLTQSGGFLLLVWWAKRRRGPDFALAPVAG